MIDELLNFGLEHTNSSIIKVIGVGGGGCNAVKNMFEEGIEGVTFLVCNTDAQAMQNNPVPGFGRAFSWTCHSGVREARTRILEIPGTLAPLTPRNDTSGRATPALHRASPTRTPAIDAGTR